uniref:Trafficking protein particle complex subunit 2-like protein n=1 Tax=Astyanax mexicanus TaxID=7994 RepID=A0A8B9GV75_ASTMX
MCGGSPALNVDVVISARVACSFAYNLLQRNYRVLPGCSVPINSRYKNNLDSNFRYGYVTNSKVKFVIVVDSSNTSLRDNEIRSMFRKLHNSFTDVMCNPFYNPGDPIQSK